MKKKAFEITIFLLLLLSVILVYRFELLTADINSPDIEKIIAGSRKLNIKNLVVYVYLGSRLLDSMIESMVILGGAFSLSYIWRKDD